MARSRGWLWAKWPCSSTCRGPGSAGWRLILAARVTAYGAGVCRGAWCRFAKQGRWLGTARNSATRLAALDHLVGVKAPGAWGGNAARGAALQRTPESWANASAHSGSHQRLPHVAALDSAKLAAPVPGEVGPVGPTVGAGGQADPTALESLQQVSGVASFVEAIGSDENPVVVRQGP